MAVRLCQQKSCLPPIASGLDLPGVLLLILFRHQLPNKLKPDVILWKVTTEGLPGFGGMIGSH